MVRRRRLAAELRRLREAAHLTCDEVATQLDCSASKISRIETGRVLVSPRDVRDLLRIYGVTGDQGDSLVQLARESRQKGWWHAYGETVQPHLATYLGMEGAASEIRIYRIGRLPGQLQTDDYTRSLLTAGRVEEPPAGHAQHLALLQERRRQAGVASPRLWVVLDETALRRETGGPGVLRAQLKHLIRLSSTPGVFLQVIPFSGGATVTDLPFAILTFADAADPDVVAIGYPTGVLWIENTAEVDWYNVLFRDLQAAALPLADSAALMTAALKDL